MDLKVANLIEKNSIPISEIDKIVLHISDRKRNIEAGGFSNFLFFKYIVLLSIIIIDIILFIISFKINLNYLSLFIFAIGNIFLFKNGYFLYENRFIFFRINNRLDRCNIDYEDLFKLQATLKRTYFELNKYYIEIEIGESILKLPIRMELYNECKNINQNSNILLIFYINSDDDLESILVKSFRVYERALLKLSDKKKKKISKKYI